MELHVFYFHLLIPFKEEEKGDRLEAARLVDDADRDRSLHSSNVDC
jgi:hypothetical protein